MPVLMPREPGIAQRASFTQSRFHSFIFPHWIHSSLNFSCHRSNSLPPTILLTIFCSKEPTAKPNTLQSKLRVVLKVYSITPDLVFKTHQDELHARPLRLPPRRPILLLHHPSRPPPPNHLSLLLPHVIHQDHAPLPPPRPHRRRE